MLVQQLATWLCTSTTSSLVIDTLVIDSRKIVHAPTAMFICIVTDNNNGHHYINNAYQQGVRCFLVSEAINEPLYTNAVFLRVNNTVIALQQMIAKYRQQFTCPVIGVTGSNGKTIVKEWLFQILMQQYNIVKSPKSYNSQIGVALSVWEMQAQHNLAIFEAGISQPNEMTSLQKMIQPNIGIFTHLGDQHSENFESVEQKFEEKLQLFDGCEVVIIPGDDKNILSLIEEKKSLETIEIFSWGKQAHNTLQIIQVIKDANHSRLNLKYQTINFEVILPFIDEASIQNALSCVATCLYLKQDIGFIQTAVASLQAVAMRLELRNGINNCTLINDSYNADLPALVIALDFLNQQKKSPRYTLILSDILESKLDKSDLYEEVADLLTQKNVSTFIGIGAQLASVQHLFEAINGLQCHFYLSTNQFLDALHQHHFNNESILIKGARRFMFEKINQALEARIHQTVLEVNLNAVTNNYNVYANLVEKDVAIMAMVKAFSYGAGAFEIANKLQFLGADYLAVAYVDEGVLLRQSGITTPIMVLNADSHAFHNMIQYQLEPELYSLAILKKFIEVCKQEEVVAYPIHLKIDTGMHRLGLTMRDLKEAMKLILDHPEIKIKSIFSHLAASDDPSLDEYTSQQASIFNEAIVLINQHIDYHYFKHICNTSGIARHPNLHYNMVRLGVGLYGVDYSSMLAKKIQHISRLKTAIAQIKYLDAGETVGYSRKGKVNKPSKIATVCIGYADGISRTLGNGKGSMYIHGKLAPIIGNVCMDMCMLDVTEIPMVQEDDEVIVFGPELPITQLAEWAGTIAYEIMTDISTRVKRVYYEE
jgi:Alr-MurF fusion protein